MSASFVVLAPVRLAAVLLHVLWGLAFALTGFRLLAQPARNRVIRFWSRLLLAAVGVRVAVRGGPVDPRLHAGVVAGSAGRLLLANHVSWLDIYAIDAVVPSRFVAKSEIARWPLAGWLVAAVGTLFVERGRRHAVHAINQQVAARLRDGESVGVFPEGTTTVGDVLLPFHANLVQPALEAGAEVRPVALRYLQQGRPTTRAAYVGDQSLLDSLWQVVSGPVLTVEVHWLAPVSTEGDRHAVAERARQAIAAALGLAEVPAAHPRRRRAVDAEANLSD